MKKVKDSRKKSSRRSITITGASGDRREERDIPSITKLIVGGWKSISQLTSIRLKGLTILAGANSSGKSSFFQPVLMLKQTLEAPYDPGALLLDGPHVRFTEASQFLSPKDKAGNFANLVIGLKTPKEFSETTYSKSPGKPIKVIQQKSRDGKSEDIIRLGMSSKDLEAQLGDEAKHMIDILARNSKMKPEFKVNRNRCFLNIQMGMGEEAGHHYTFVLGSNNQIVQAIRSIIHLPGLRGNPERTYPLNATEGYYPGQFQSYTASLIQKWQDSSNKAKLQELNQALTELGLTSEITTSPVDETRVEIKVGRLLQMKGQDYVSIADVGLAVSQVLPVLVALAVAHPGQLVFVEQPELHLHPRAQVQLATIIARAIRKGVRILLETHSSLLLLGIQTAVAKGHLSPNDVALHWFTRNDDGVTCVAAAALDNTGAFGDWPEDFGDVSMKAEADYLDAAERALLAEQNAR